MEGERERERERACCRSGGQGCHVLRIEGAEVVLNGDCLRCSGWSDEQERHTLLHEKREEGGVRRCVDRGDEDIRQSGGGS